MKKVLNFKVSLLIVVLVVLLAACQNDTDKAESNKGSDSGEPSSETRVSDESIGISDDKIKIGIHMGITGPAALLATEMINGWEAAVNELNKEGIHGREIDLIVEDDEYNPAKSVAVIRKLVDRDNVFAVTGGGTPTVMGVLDYLMEKEVPYMFPFAGQYEKLNSVAGKEEAPYLFMAHPDYATQYYILTKYIVEEQGIDKIGILYQNDDAGSDIQLGVNKALEDLGIELVAAEGFEANATDYTSQIQKVRNAGAEAVVLGTAVRQGALIVEQADAQGYHPQYFTHTTFADANFLDLLGPLAEGIMGVNFLNSEDDESAEMERFLSALEEVESGKEPTFFTMYAYSTMMSIGKAIEEAGESPTREKVVEVIQNWEDKETELMGTLTFSADNHDGKKIIYPTQIIDGKWTQIDDWLTLPEDVDF